MAVPMDDARELFTVTITEPGAIGLKFHEEGDSAHPKFSVEAHYRGSLLIQMREGRPATQVCPGCVLVAVQDVAVTDMTLEDGLARFEEAGDAARPLRLTFDRAPVPAYFASTTHGAR